MFLLSTANGDRASSSPGTPSHAHRALLPPALLSYMLDVLTPLSDCRRESVEKMERRTSGVLHMCWMDFYNGILCCGFSCARLIAFSFVSFLCVSFGATTPRATTPHLYPAGYHALTTTARLSRLCTSPGYHSIAYFYSLAITPELSRSCLLYTSPSPRDQRGSRMPSSA